jgi:hypothetical protein
MTALPATGTATYPGAATYSADTRGYEKPELPAHSEREHHELEARQQLPINELASHLQRDQ